MDSHGTQGLNKSMCKSVYFIEKLKIFWCKKTSCQRRQIAIYQIWSAWRWQRHLAPTSWHQVSLSSSLLPWKHFRQSMTVTWQQEMCLLTLFSYYEAIHGNTWCYIIMWDKDALIQPTRSILSRSCISCTWPIHNKHIFVINIIIKLCVYKKKKLNWYNQCDFWKTRTFKPLKFPFLFGWVFRGLGLPVDRFLRCLQHRLSRSDPVTDWPFAALTSLEGEALRVQAAGGHCLANILATRHIAWDL